jgi:uncharacterized protein with ParB-like and HNH nuclease domain
MDVTPIHQNIDKVFSNTIYYIDFYQRDYRWTKEPVERLLDDIFYKFNVEYPNHISLDPKKETVNDKYPWYYLNTFVTNVVNGQTYIVDGQQRLTTLSLILIKLRLLAKSLSLKEERVKWLENKICGYSGDGYEFWMCHVHHKDTLSDLYEGVKIPSDINVGDRVTSINLVNNFKIISERLEKELKTAHKLETFIFYYLYRLVLINLDVAQTDVPMIFEVINDRGVRLKPYEILKGKILGQIDKFELDHGKYNETWESKINSMNSLYEDISDSFFRYLLKSKFSNSRKDGSKFDGEYHREMFSPEVDQFWNLKHNPAGVKLFFKNQFVFFSDSYLKVLKHYKDFNPKQKYVFFNRLNEQDGQFLLILSSLLLNDPEEDNKIFQVSYELDRYFSLLQLQNSYDSNAFADSLFKISLEIREQPISSLRESFDRHIVDQIKMRHRRDIDTPFSYQIFKNIGYSNLNSRFLRYFFARVEEFIATNTNQEMRHSISDLVTKTGAKSGFHVEHILSHNSENLLNFQNQDDHFEQERNRLGGLLLMKGRDNISSGNEVYPDKLKSYAQTLLWNESLREDSYKSKLDTLSLKSRYGLDLVPYSHFGPLEIEKRHSLLFSIASIIWK